MNVNRFAATVACLALLAAAGCGGDESTGATEPTTPPSTSTDSASTTGDDQGSLASFVPAAHEVGLEAEAGSDSYTAGGQTLQLDNVHVYPKGGSADLAPLLIVDMPDEGFRDAYVTAAEKGGKVAVSGTHVYVSQDLTQKQVEQFVDGFEGGG